MSNRKGLEPTVITNKNGVLTTVYRKPGKTMPPSRRRAPVPTSEDREFYLLQKELTPAVSHPALKHYEHDWRRRVLRAAKETKDISLLQHLKKHFRADGGSFESALEIIDAAYMDHRDRALFELVLTFTGLTRNSGTRRLQTMLPLLLAHPDQVERIAHHMNVTAYECKPVTPEAVTELLSTPIPTSNQLPAHLAATLAPSATPVSDRRLVYTTLTESGEQYAYSYLTDYDEQTITYFANAIRSGDLTPDIAKMIIKNHMSPRTSAEFVALLASVSDLIGQVDNVYEASIMGPNREFFSKAFSKLRYLHPDLNHEKESLDPLPIDTEEEFAAHSAIYRFLLTIEHTNGRKLHKIGWSTRYSSDDPYDRKLIDLLSRRNSEREVRMLVNLFNERGPSDAKQAEEFLNDQSAAAVSEGWL